MTDMTIMTIIIITNLIVNINQIINQIIINI